MNGMITIAKKLSMIAYKESLDYVMDFFFDLM